MKKSVYLLIALISVFMVICIFNDTYSLFETEGLAVTEISTGNWVIEINDVDITNEQTEFVIDNFIYTANSNVADNKIAPGRSGYADILIDPTGTDVSVKYDITFDFSGPEFTSSVTGEVTGLLGNSVVQTGENTYSGVISLEDIEQSVTNSIRISVVWNNDEANNDSDSELGSVYDNLVSIPITVTACQYSGEPLIPYE